MKRLWILAPVLAVAACSSNQEPLGSDFGNAVELNRTAHIINPAPVYPAPAATDGQRLHGAHDRYLRGEVREAGGISTTDGGIK